MGLKFPCLFFYKTDLLPINEKLGCSPPSAQKVNQELSNGGLQNKPETTWELTEAGKKYGIFPTVEAIAVIIANSITAVDF